MIQRYRLWKAARYARKRQQKLDAAEHAWQQVRPAWATHGDRLAFMDDYWRDNGG